MNFRLLSKLELFLKQSKIWKYRPTLSTRHKQIINKFKGSNRYWIFISCYIGFYIYLLKRAKKSDNELMRMGASGSLTMFICDFSCYSIESINARTKIVRGENVPFMEMVKKVLRNEGLAGMYKGYSASFYSIIIHGFGFYYLYKGLKLYMKEHI